MVRIKNIATIARKELRDILSEKLYLFAFLAELIIVMGIIYASLLYVSVSSPQSVARITKVEKPRVAVYNLGERMKNELAEELNLYEIGKNEVNLSNPISALLTLRKKGISALLIKESSNRYILALDNTNVLSGYIDLTISRVIKAREEEIRREFLEKELGNADIITEPIKVRELYLKSRSGYVREKPIEFISIMYGFLMPFIFLLPIFLASNMISDSIAGEKERKTYEMLLIAPLKKSEIIIGKTLPILAIAMLQEIAWLVILEARDIVIYNKLLLLVLLFLLNLIFIGMGIFISAISTTLKEANLTITIMIIISSIALFAPLRIKSFLLSLNPIKLITKLSSNPGIEASIFMPIALFAIIATLIYLASIRYISENETIVL